MSIRAGLREYTVSLFPFSWRFMCCTGGVDLRCMSHINRELGAVQNPNVAPEGGWAIQRAL